MIPVVQAVSCLPLVPAKLTLLRAQGFLRYFKAIMANWRAIQCEPQREALARVGLKARGFPVWYPYRVVRRWRPGNAHKVRVAYFPCYLFADIEGWRTARWEIERLPGAVAVLGERPIAEPIMNALIARADADGRVYAPPLKPGDPISVGILVGKLVSLDSHKAEVLIPFLGAMRSLRVSIADLLADPVLVA